MSIDVETQIKQAATRNAELLKTLTETDYATPALKEQIRFIKDLEAQIRASEKELKSLEQKRKSELKDHEKYRDSTVRRLLFKATGRREKFEAQAEKEEKEYFEVLQKEHEAQNVNNGLRHQLDQATQMKGQLESVTALHDNTQRELDSLYDAIFSGTTPSFPQEDELEKKSNQALQSYHDTRVRQEECAHKANLLDQSANNVLKALQQMEEALGYSRMDMFGGGSYADMMERNCLSKASLLVMEARNFAQRAGVRDLPNVDINQGSIISDVLFDNIFTDMAFHDEIKRGKIELQRLAMALQGRLSAAQSSHLKTTQELKEAEKQLENSRHELQLERQTAFEKVLKDEKALKDKK